MDAHVTAWYEQRWPYQGVFAGQRRAVLRAHTVACTGGQYDDFGSMHDMGYYCRVLFDDSPWIVCYREDATGVCEITNEHYEREWAMWEESRESE